MRSSIEFLRINGHNAKLVHCPGLGTEVILDGRLIDVTGTREDALKVIDDCTMRPEVIYCVKQDGILFDQSHTGTGE